MNPAASVADRYHLAPQLRIRAVQVRNFAGLDLGQKQDHTALTLVERHVITFDQRDPATWAHLTENRYVVTHLERIPLGTPYPEIVEHVRSVLRKVAGLDAPVLIVDATGVGGVFTDLLKARGLGRNLSPVTITSGQSETRNGTGFGVPKRDLITGLQIAFESRELGFAAGIGPALETLMRELMEMRCEVTPSGHERFGVWRSGMHDDLVLATALAWWGARKRDGPPFWGTRRLL